MLTVLLHTLNNEKQYKCITENPYLVFKINYLSTFYWLKETFLPSWIDAYRHFLL